MADAPFATVTFAPDPCENIADWPELFLTKYIRFVSLGDTVMVFVPEGEPPKSRT